LPNYSPRNYYMSSIFLSHSHKDKLFARKLAERLKNAGVKVWIDEAEMKVGDSLIEKIGKGIADTSYLAVILSPASVSSEWVRREVNIALTQEIKGKKKKVLPILYRPCDIPDFLSDKLYADFTNDFEEGFIQLLGTVKEERKTESGALKLGLWGGPGSGKTTYIASLLISALQMSGKRSWMIRGADRMSLDWLVTMTDNLRRGLFPNATNTIRHLSFVLESLPQSEDVNTKMYLNVTDIPGGAFSSIDGFEEYLHYMANCDGLILFLNEDTTSWEIITKNIHAMMELLGASKALPQKLAVCLTQYDEQKLFSQLREKGFLSVNGYKGRQIPFVKDARKAIIENVRDGNMIVKTLETSFIPSNIRYAAISSIGFCTPSEDKFNIDDCSNVLITTEGRRIRNESNLTPVNVWAPIAWFADS